LGDAFQAPSVALGVVPFQQGLQRTDQEVNYGEYSIIHGNTGIPYIVIIEPAKSVQENTLALLFGVYIGVFMCL